MTRLEELAEEINELIDKKGRKSIIYERFAIYEDFYCEIRNPSPKEQNDYIKLYFKYSGFMER